MATDAFGKEEGIGKHLSIDEAVKIISGALESENYNGLCLCPSQNITVILFCIYEFIHSKCRKNNGLRINPHPNKGGWCVGAPAKANGIRNMSFRTGIFLILTRKPLNVSNDRRYSQYVISGGIR